MGAKCLWRRREVRVRYCVSVACFTVAVMIADIMHEVAVKCEVGGQYLRIRSQIEARRCVGVRSAVEVGAKELGAT